MTRHHVQIVEPAGLPLMFHGIFYDRSLRRYQVCPYVDGRALEPLPLERGDAMANLARAFLLEVEEKSSGCHQRQ
jgi:hypothetical protein